MNDLSRRVLQARNAAKISQEELANKVGCSQATIMKIEAGKTERTRYLAEIAAALGKTAEWLAGGKEESVENVELAPDLHKQVPLLGSVSAGNFVHTTELEPHEIETWLMSPKDYKGRAFGLRVTGDSMTSPTGKSYPDGSIAVFDSGNKTPHNGDLILAKVNGADEVTFKKFVSDAGRQYLMPLNQSHPRIDDPFRVLAVFEYAIIF